MINMAMNIPFVSDCRFGNECTHKGNIDIPLSVWSKYRFNLVPDTPRQRR